VCKHVLDVFVQGWWSGAVATPPRTELAVGTPMGDSHGGGDSYHATGVEALIQSSGGDSTNGGDGLTLKVRVDCVHTASEHTPVIGAESDAWVELCMGIIGSSSSRHQASLLMRPLGRGRRTRTSPATQAPLMPRPW
jgi:hypothetical protein